ncbi:MAG: hypothetical protein ACQERS_13265 [Bacteroidota bacterium]
MKTFLKIFFSALIISAFVIGSCKKQPKCGCDGDIINELVGFPVYVYYDTSNVAAWFNPINSPTSTYYFCNPSDYMSYLKRFDQGAYLLVDGHVYWECNYLMQASNNSYYSYLYKTYQIDVTDLYEDLYGK